MAGRTRAAASAHHRPHLGRAGVHGDRGDQPLRRAGVGTDQGTAAGQRGPDIAAAAPRLCAVCGRQDRGFAYTRELRFDRYPSYRFCSMRCLDGGSALAGRNNGMIDKTDMERQAIKDARRFFAEALTELGLMKLFHDRSAADIDRLIEACIDGFQDSMQRQSLNDDIRF
jgi:uncharacterized protein DUF6511